MPVDMTELPGRALAELARQHDELRALLDRCDQLAGQPDRDGVAAALADEVIRLRAAFGRHNAYEEQLLRPLLAEIDPFAAAQIDRMIADHIAEHRRFGHRLATLESDTLRDVIETLRAHLDAEERYLLSSRVLHDAARAQPA
jgi:iron-sulfur cluster repair protein YtfE (RIC family)